MHTDRSIGRAARRPTLGIDVGGVLVDRVAEGSDTSFFGNRPMDTPAVVGSIEAIPDLVHVFEHRVHIVSKAGPKITALTREWLRAHGVIGDELIPVGNLHFVRKRRDKHGVCERLGITHFVDDRMDVLAHLGTVDHRLLFTGGLGRHQPPDEVPDWATVADSWPSLVALLRRGLES